MSFQLQNSTIVVNSYSFESTIIEYTKRLHTLVQLEEKGQTHYTGEELNILERISDKICNDEKLNERDLFEIEKLTIKYL